MSSNLTYKYKMQKSQVERVSLFALKNIEYSGKLFDWN